MSQLRIYDLYHNALDEINIEERGQLTIDRFNRFANKAIHWLIDYLTGRLQEMPQPRIELLKNQKLADLLFPLMKKKMVPFSGGVVPYPLDYNFLIDLRVSGGVQPAQDCTAMPAHTLEQILAGVGGFRQVDVLSHDQVSSRVNSHIPLLKKKGCAEQYDTGFLLHTGQVSGSAFMAYLKEPEPVKLVMRLDEETQSLVYDDGASAHPPLHVKTGFILARKIGQYFAHWVREEGAVGLSDAVSKTE